MAKPKDPLQEVRKDLYKGASAIGDIEAVVHGHIAKRIVRKFATRKLSGFLRKLLK